MQLDSAPIRVRRYFRDFDPTGEAAGRFYEPFRVGFEDRHADVAAALVLDGTKTTTSSLLWEYEHSGRALPEVGSLSVLLDGRHDPVCVVESTRVEVLPFDAIEATFCAGYGECDGTVAGWKDFNWPIYRAQCRELGLAASTDMPLVCETFAVRHPDKAAALALADALRRRLAGC